MFNYFFGVDVSKNFFDITLLNQQEQILFQKKLKMNDSGFNEINSMLKEYPKKEVLFCMESTGIYHLTLLFFLLEQGCSVAVVNPLLIHSFIQSISLRKTKTDKNDAFSIALFALRNNNSLRLSTKDELDNLKPLLREKQELVKNSSRLKTQIKALLIQLFPELLERVNVFTKSIMTLLLKAPGQKPINDMKKNKIDEILNLNKSKKVDITARQIKKMAERSIGLSSENLESILVSKINQLLFLKNEIKSFNKIIKESFGINSDLNNDLNILLSIRGIGDETAQMFLSELGSIDRFQSHKKLTAYIGTDPAIKQSGSSIDKQGKITKRGNAHLRRTIYLMAVCTARYNDLFKVYFKKKMTEGKKFKQAIIAVANKLIRVIFAMLKNKSLFNSLPVQR